MYTDFLKNLKEELKKDLPGEKAQIKMAPGIRNHFKPNEKTDPKFAEIFWKARKAGVEIYPVKLSYENGSIIFHGLIPVCEIT